jgi:hypothetical protein
MIRGIRLKHYQRILEQGESAPNNKWITYLLLKQSNKAFKTRDITQMRFVDFVDCERAIEDKDFYNFCRIFVRRKWLQVIYVHNLKLIVEDYAKQKAELIEQYRWVFDPPQFGEPPKETQGSELRKDFVNEFGSYIVLMDLICNTDITRYKEVEQWKLEEFMFWANYKSGQRILETVK